MKFKIEMTVEFKDFVIPSNKSQSMINGMQREQVAFALQDKLADMNLQIPASSRFRNMPSISSLKQRASIKAS
jgi:hypothetical protein